MSVANPNFVAVSELTPGLAGETSSRVVSGLLPNGAVAQMAPRNSIWVNLGALLTGREQVGLIYLEKGTVVTRATFVSGTTAAVTPTNQWVTLRDVNRNLLRVSNDDLTAAWNANVPKTFTFASSYTVTLSGYFYIGIVVAAATVPTLTGGSAGATGGVFGLAPIVCGFDNVNTGLTTPATAPAVSAAYTSAQAYVYFYIS